MKENGVYLPKRTASAFVNPKLRKELGRYGANALVMVGLYAEGCVAATARASLRLDRGYAVTLLYDEIGSSSDAKRDKTIRKLQTAGALIADTNSFLEHLAG